MWIVVFIIIHEAFILDGRYLTLDTITRLSALFTCSSSPDFHVTVTNISIIISHAMAMKPFLIIITIDDV